MATDTTSAEYPEDEGAAERTDDPLADRGRNTLGTLGLTFVVQAIGLVTGILASRVLGVEGRGQLAALLVWPYFITYVGDLGIPIAYVHMAAAHPDQRAQLRANSIVIGVAQWILLAVVGAVTLPLALSRQDPSWSRIAFLFLVAYLPLNLLTRYLNGVNQGARSFRWFNAIRLSVPASYALALIALFSVGARSVVWVLVATLFSNLVAALFALWCARPFSKWLPLIVRPSWSLARSNLRYGLKAHIGNLTPVDSLQIDMLLVTALLTATQSGLYSVALSAATVVRAMGTAIGMVALPDVAAARSPRAAAEAAATFTRTAMVLCIAAGLAISILARPLVVLVYGEPFANAWPLVIVLCLGVVMASMRQVLGDCLRGMNRPSDATVAEITSWIVGAAALAILLPTMGAVGAAIGVSVSYGAALVVTMIYARRAQISLRDLLIPRVSDFVRLAQVLSSAIFRLRQRVVG